MRAPRSPLAPLFSVTLAVAAAACTGTLGDGVDRSSGKSGGVGAGDDGGTSNTTSACVSGAIAPGDSPMRRLTSFEYDNTVRDLLGDATAPAKAFPNDIQVNGFDNNAGVLTVSQALAQAYMTSAEQLSTTAIASLAKLLPCSTSPTGQDACAAQFITSFGRRAFRRPLSTDEVTRLAALYGNANTQWGFSTAIQLVLQAMLESPNFLYRPEFGVVQSGAQVVKLAPYELASRLSYLVWGSMPDDALLDAADHGGLDTKEQIAAQARRMLADPKAADAVAHFHLAWLGVSKMELSQKVASIYPKYTSAIGQLMEQETAMLVNDVVLKGDGTLASLLTAPYTFANKQLATYYGLAGPTATAFERVPLDPKQRGGVLTQGSVMTFYANPNESSPIRRGKLVRLQLLCQPPPPPPPNINVSPPPVDPNATTRQQFAVHDTNPACSGCHTLMDPIGFGFENFDAVGAYRATDHGQPVDSSGDLEGTSDANGKFVGAVELGQRLAKSQDVEKCVVLQWFRYANGRTEGNDDACAIERLDASFAATHGNIRELIVALTQSDSFLYRKAVTP